MSQTSRAAWLGLILLLASAGTALGDPGELRVETDVSLQGTSAEGSVTWTATGDQATSLRARILGLFDDTITIPIGFRHQGLPTGATPLTVSNGILDGPEVAGFLEVLGRVLAGNGTAIGTTFRHLGLTSAAPASLPAESSTTGLVGLSPNSTEPLTIRLQIRGSASGNEAFSQAGDSLPRAIHDVFAFDFPDNLQTAACPPDCAPLRMDHGWRVVESPPPGRFNWTAGEFLWFADPGAEPWSSNTSYSNGEYASSFYSLQGVNDDQLDLRFATQASMQFEHTGNANGSHNVEVKIKRTDVSTWTDLVSLNDDDGIPGINEHPLEVLETSTFDLTPWVGGRVDLRMRFSSQDSQPANGTGIYIRNIRIQADFPSSGSIAVRHSESLWGTSSLVPGTTAVGSLSVVRTPLGEFVTYQSTFTADATVGDTASVGFDPAESPQLLFAMLLGSVFVNRRLTRRWSAGASPPKWWPLTLVGALVPLFVLYTFPTVAGGYVPGGVVWAGAMLVAVGLPWIAARVVVARPVALAAVPAVVAEPEKPRKAPLPSPIERVPRGLNYLVLAEGPEQAYGWFNEMVEDGSAGFCLSTTFPEKLKTQHGLWKEVETGWLSSTKSGPHIYNPKRLEFEITRAVVRFLTEHPDGVIILDGLEYLTVENGLDRVLRFLKTATDLASAAGSTLFVPLAPGILGPEDLGRLRKEFDRVEVLAVPLAAT